MSQVVYVNGELVPKERAVISVFDHGLLYGDGVFEGLRAYGGNVFRLDKHIERLYRSAHALMLEVPLSPSQMSEAVLLTLQANGFTDAYVRLVVTRGAGDLGLDPWKCSRPAVVIIAELLEMYPARFYEDGLELITLSTRRNSRQALEPAIKSLNYLNNILGKIECVRAGVAEGIMLNLDGQVAEATADNLFILKGGSLVTPPRSAGILDGITRGVVIELAQGRGIGVREEALHLYDVYNAEECFLTGTGAEIAPVVKVDGRQIGSGRPGPMTRELIEEFRSLVRRDGVSIRSH